MWSLTLILTLATSQAQVTYNSGDYYQSVGGSSDCTTGYQPIKDVKACKEAAEAVAGLTFDTIYHRYPINAFPNYCTTKHASGDVNYWINPESDHTDVAWSVLCISSSKTCSDTTGSGTSSSYPCVCGDDVCAMGEVCNATASMCEVMKGYVETERKDKSCPTGYQQIIDAVACMEVADSMPYKRWGAVYDYHSVPYGCGSWTTGIVNYYVAPYMAPGTSSSIAPFPSAGVNDDVDVAMICIDSSMTCSVMDGSGESDSYPCTCGDDVCATGEVCADLNGWKHCQVIKTIYQTERKTKDCPMGYKAIDEPKCWELAKLLNRTWMKFPIFSGVAQGCGSWNFDTVQYFDYPGDVSVNSDPASPATLYVPAGQPDNVENARLCIGDNDDITYDRCLNPYDWAPCIQ